MFDALHDGLDVADDVGEWLSEKLTEMFGLQAQEAGLSTSLGLLNALVMILIRHFASKIPIISVPSPISINLRSQPNGDEVAVRILLEDFATETDSTAIKVTATVAEELEL